MRKNKGSGPVPETKREKVYASILNEAHNKKPHLLGVHLGNNANSGSIGSFVFTIPASLIITTACAGIIITSAASYLSYRISKKIDED